MRNIKKSRKNQWQEEFLGKSETVAHMIFDPSTAVTSKYNKALCAITIRNEKRSRYLSVSLLLKQKELIKYISKDTIKTCMWVKGVKAINRMLRKLNYDKKIKEKHFDKITEEKPYYSLTRLYDGLSTCRIKLFKNHEAAPEAQFIFKTKMSYQELLEKSA